MNICELSNKAEYIAGIRKKNLEQWRYYCNTLIKGITLSKAKLYHEIEYSPTGDLSFCLFNHFIIHVRLTNDFICNTITFHLEEKRCSGTVLIGKAKINNTGYINSDISIHDREKILEHYLKLISPLYDCLYGMVKRNDDTQQSRCKFG